MSNSSKFEQDETSVLLNNLSLTLRASPAGRGEYMKHQVLKLKRS